MTYSDTILRGLAADDWVRDGIVTAAAFQIKFEEKFMKNDCAAQSICWEDDASVVDLMLHQKKDDGIQLQFKIGITRARRENIDTVFKQPVFREIIYYERDPLPDNKYHGNFLIKPNSKIAQRKLLQAVIASHFTDIILRT